MLHLPSNSKASYQNGIMPYKFVLNCFVRNFDWIFTPKSSFSKEPLARTACKTALNQCFLIYTHPSLHSNIFAICK